ncbi:MULTISPECIES: type II toxin-antitoxin system VapB family antitoxin [unclassified Micromonospora]|uniref:type II toxin-antitoxin system VapB family antitoxin n=1 Tax=unclassified Micromonospora TaxID=2617518 RepID=UPI0022B6BE10|nr:MULTISPECIES: type II toxin-antitoxin system VapB family antitoxin [unclassified Micromonospora]MCZ7418565.1 type II toxin-antitoxin system VapB family antitoxin [Verrucosispora sp. WMMA2121]WBB92277.1 type II toxin-antitoxin system VapB family antitoxin [Verrucosispora sp. WMMC514]
MKTVIDLDDDLLERARRELGTKSKKDTIHAALRMVAERSERMEAIRELLSIDRDWTGLLEDDKTPGDKWDAA